MGFFSDATRELNHKYPSSPSTSLSSDDYENIHIQAVEKLLKKHNASKGKGIDVEVTDKQGNKINVEVTVLPSWVGDDFPADTLTIKKQRLKKPNQWFVYFSADLTKITYISPKMLNQTDNDGNYQIPKSKLKIKGI